MKCKRALFKSKLRNVWKGSEELLEKEVKKRSLSFFKLFCLSMKCVPLSTPVKVLNRVSSRDPRGKKEKPSPLDIEFWKTTFADVHPEKLMKECNHQL